MDSTLLLVIVQYCALVGNSLSYKTGPDCVVDVVQCSEGGSTLYPPHSRDVEKCMKDYLYSHSKIK